MYELIPLLAGCAAGLLVRSVRSLWLAVAMIVIVALASGTLAATISGELEISPALVLWDVGQGVFAGLAVLVLARRLSAGRAEAR